MITITIEIEQQKEGTNFRVTEDPGKKATPKERALGLYLVNGLHNLVIHYSAFIGAEECSSGICTDIKEAEMKLNIGKDIILKGSRRGKR